MASNQVATVALVLVGLIAVVALIKGAARTFRRNWTLALLLLLFLTPIWVVWAIIEALSGPLGEAVPMPLPTQVPSLHPTENASADLHRKEIWERAERARNTILTSGNQQLIDHLNLMDAVGVAAVTPTDTPSSLPQAPPAHANGSEPVRTISGWQKRKAVAERRKEDHPYLRNAGRIFALVVLGFSGYVGWALVSTRYTPEYAACLKSYGSKPSEEAKSDCTSAVAGKLYFGH